MKKMGIFMIAFMFCLTINAQNNEITLLTKNMKEIKLLPPQKKGGMPLMEALANRKTNREFSAQELTSQQLSNLLWAASGVNRSDGKRTAPTARNAQQIEIYVMNKWGVYLYLPKEHVLHLIAEGDFRKESVSQEHFQECPLILIYVANYDKMQGFSEESKLMYEGTDTGFISQNVYLYCASEGLSTCVIGSIYRDKLQKLLKFNGKAILGQIVGVAK